MENLAVHDVLLDELEKVIVGQRENVRLVLATLLTGGHVLLEDRPGVGKTALAKSIGAVFGLPVSRIQGTPDLLPTDITGVHIFNPETREWDFRPGPIFSPLVLVDELNRATAKAQSALLEAMSERQVTVDGTTMALPDPFMVIATQNPSGEIGTHRLASAQVDRFSAQVSLGLPGRRAELSIVSSDAGASRVSDIRPVVQPGRLPELFAAARNVQISPTVAEYVVDVVTTLRMLGPEVWLSVRVSETLLRVAQGFAFMQGRGYVAPDDVQAVALSVVRHRISDRFSDEQLRLAITTQAVPVHDAA